MGEKWKKLRIFSVLLKPLNHAGAPNFVNVRAGGRVG